MPKHSALTVFVVLLSILCFLAALTELVLASWTAARIEAHRHHDLYYDYSYNKYIDYIPDSFDAILALPYFEIGAGVVGLLGSLAALALSAVLLFRKNKNNSLLSLLTSIFLFLAALVNVALLGWVFELTVADSADFYLGGSGSIESSFEDQITFEGYVCGLQPLISEFDGGRWWNTSCDLAQGARWTMVPLTILLFFTAVLATFAGVVQARQAKKSRHSRGFENNAMFSESQYPTSPPKY